MGSSPVILKTYFDTWRSRGILGSSSLSFWVLKPFRICLLFFTFMMKSGTFSTEPISVSIWITCSQVPSSEWFYSAEKAALSVAQRSVNAEDRCLTLAVVLSIPLSAFTIKRISIALMILGFVENLLSLPRVILRRLEIYPSLSSAF